VRAGKGKIDAVNRLLIVDDDHALVNLLKRFLEGEGFQVDAAYDHASGLSAALAGGHELIVLDVMLPGGSGFELLKELRHQSQVPVLLLTARGEAVDRIVGLEIGADDYLGKPFDPRELVARIRAIFRRTREPAPTGARSEPEEVLTVGEISMSLSSRAVTCAGKPVDFTSVEFNVLELLLRHAGTVVTREQIAEVALGRPLNFLDRSVDVHVSHVRRKLGACLGTDELIKPIRGIGYFLAAETAEKTKV
jgi:two-component system response regulator CpxR